MGCAASRALHAAVTSTTIVTSRAARTPAMGPPWSRRPLLLDRVPRRVGIERGHRARRRGRLGTEILLPHDAAAVDDERHDAGRIVLRRPRDEREAARHLAADDERLRAARRVRALLREDFEIVAV